MRIRILTPLALVLAVAACSPAAETPEPAAAPPAAESATEQAAEAAPAEEAEEAAPAAEAPAEEAAAQAPAGMGHDHAPAIDVPEEEIVAQPSASVGDAVRCPVSKEPFRVTETSASVEHEGAQVYFCCGSCIRPFQRDPENYLGQATP